ncbi:FHA domain-containing protein [Noviherbaspirillum saxi]|uniref:FHA domain-containing protein n=2 Tax=Noviherbaspirillum saxi TaxID=2320863 RepID=A0A3A3FMC4_9BURK|nr:FHA domain-containing protein [Noviherbaspirillum saxi]
MRSAGGNEVDIRLKPVSHSELEEIRIGDALFPVGRTEPPFDTYAPELVVDLSRRHARIFCEYGAVYIADLGSKNGTTVNGEDIRQKTRKLHDGDVICFGGTLCFSIELRAVLPAARPAGRLTSVTLTPSDTESGLQPIVVTRFPFLISKADEAFARYKEQHPQQLNYLSRRHAHIFQKGGAPYIEDLGSTNGTFLTGRRLDEHAARLQQGDMLAFGGHHFVYRVSYEEEQPEADPTLTKFARPQAAVAQTGDADKTTFIASADSFLDIFCVDAAPAEEAGQETPAATADASPGADKPPASGKHSTLRLALREVFPSGERRGLKRSLLLGTGALAVVSVVATGVYLSGAPERELGELLANGEYAKAAAAADQYLARQPESAALKAFGTEAVLRAGLPEWLRRLQKKDFDGADKALAATKESGRRNDDVQGLIDELQWVGTLERFVIGRGGLEAPIRMYVDDQQIKALLKWWDEDPSGHQRALGRVSVLVPEFKEPYAVALSHLRKLQSDKAVYLAAIDRLHATIADELNQDRPEALEAVFKEYTEKYPRLAGMEALQGDLREYIALRDLASARRLSPLVAQLSDVRFATPPFEARMQALRANGSLPSAPFTRQYQEASQAWNEGNTGKAIATLEQMPSGPWSDVAAKRLDHKREITSQFDAVQKARGTKAYDERLLAFYAMLEADEDGYFIRAIDADVRVLRDKAIKQADDILARAQVSWRRYRENGAIAGAQRLESGVSNEFRAQARLLSGASEDANKGARIYQDLKVTYPSQWAKLQSEIQAEAELQRRSMMELQRVIEPGVLKAKLALLGGVER